MHGPLGRNGVFTQLHAAMVRNSVEMSVGSIRRCMFDGCVGDADRFAIWVCG